MVHPFSPEVQCCTINMYAKCGDIDTAESLFRSIKSEAWNIVTVNTMISGYAQYGKIDQAFELFHSMINLKPNEETFVCLLNTCSHAIQPEKAKIVYEQIHGSLGKHPSNTHTACLIDAYCRAGMLQQALQLLRETKVEDIVCWVTLLGGCRSANDLEMGRVVFDKIMKIDNRHAASYVLMSNLLSSNGLEKDVENLRQTMSNNNITKIPGITTVEINGVFHRFVCDESNHPQMDIINRELDILVEELIQAGYTINTSLVTKTGLSEQEKRKLICRHSEKMAMAYAFTQLPKGSTIKLQNNLRVCFDCHTALKFISKIRGCEIIVRDARRYHTFKDGKCDCGDCY